jgi:hypothetical protein
MPFLAGFHVEGNDYLILRALAAKLLDVAEDDIVPVDIDTSGRGWDFVLAVIPNALKRFYAQCAQFVIVGVDNDGNVDLDLTGNNEDPNHPRHDNHKGTVLVTCRHCKIMQAIAQVRPQLNWIPKKPGATWPILVAVPVEMIETWLLILRDANPGFQRKPRSAQKQLLYGRPVATKSDVLTVALPLVHGMTATAISHLASVSPSFQDFSNQIIAAKAVICDATDCW